MKNNQSGNSDVVTLIMVVFVLGLFCCCVGGCMYGMPKYNVYKNRLAGEAELARAHYSKQVAVQEAQAKLDSSSKLAEVEVARARGVAEANRIIGESLKGNESYLRYLWIQGLENNPRSVIYVPTEAGLPILEAGRLGETK